MRMVPAVQTPGATNRRRPRSGLPPATGSVIRNVLLMKLAVSRNILTKHQNHLNP